VYHGTLNANFKTAGYCSKLASPYYFIFHSSPPADPVFTTPTEVSSFTVTLREKFFTKVK
jgi:hypothetical protein